MERYFFLHQHAGIYEQLRPGLHLSEAHTGFRAYHRKLLETIPFPLTSDKFVFDSKIIAQAVAFGFRTDSDKQLKDVISRYHSYFSRIDNG